MTINLAFNATALLSPLTGIGYYTFNLAKELVKCQHINADFFYSLYWDKKIHDTHHPNVGNILATIRSHIPYSYELRHFLQTVKFKRHTKKNKFDLYHEPNYLLLPFNGPKVVTVHDLSWVHYPELHPIERVRALNKFFVKSLEQASYVITDSEYIRSEVIEYLGINPEKVKSIHLGVESSFIPQNSHETRHILQKYQLQHNQYLLAIGTLEPRKNLGLVLKAYSQLNADTRRHYPLVIVGMKGWKSDTLETTYELMLQRGEIRFLGYIPRVDLATITAGATTLIYPSIYEGFGLPPLEAMACAVPPIVSNVASLPEVVGSAGITISPNDDKTLVNAIQHIIENPSYRAELSIAALKRASTMTWQKCAQKTRQVYHQAVC